MSFELPVVPVKIDEKSLEEQGTRIGTGSQLLPQNLTPLKQGTNFRRQDPVAYWKQNPFGLAPMAGITDSAFRSFMRDMGAGILVSELVSATGLHFSSARTRSLAHYSEEQRPVGIQLFGEDPEHLALAARWVQDQGADFVDLNFGCPVPKVVKKGAGSAVLKDLAQLERILSRVRSAIEIPLTIKIRTGWDQGTRNAPEVLKIASDQGVSWVAIHGRTRAQGYSGLADWDYIGEAKARAPKDLLVIGNGDLVTASMARERLKTYHLDGVLIGRGCLKNPHIFRQAQGATVSDRDLWPVFEQLKIRLEQTCDERILQIQLKKFAAWFASGYPGASLFRKQVFQLPSAVEILECTHRFFSELSLNEQADTTEEAFLMGGHG